MYKLVRKICFKLQAHIHRFLTKYISIHQQVMSSLSLSLSYSTQCLFHSIALEHILFPNLCSRFFSSYSSRDPFPDSFPILLSINLHLSFPNLSFFGHSRRKYEKVLILLKPLSLKQNTLSLTKD